MRCFRCQSFGHTHKWCRNRPVCAKCSSTEHLDVDCEAERYRCLNCGDGQTPRTAYDRNCPSLLREKEINALKATRKISFREARELYDRTHPSQTYAQKANAPVSAKTTLEQMKATQLERLLNSFSLTVVAADAAPAGAVPVGVPSLVTALVPSSPSIPPSRLTTAPEAVNAAANSGEGGDVRTVVQRRRTGGGGAPRSVAASSSATRETLRDGNIRRSHPQVAVLPSGRRLFWRHCAAMTRTREPETLEKLAWSSGSVRLASLREATPTLDPDGAQLRQSGHPSADQRRDILPMRCLLGARLRWTRRQQHRPHPRLSDCATLRHRCPPDLRAGKGCR